MAPKRKSQLLPGQQTLHQLKKWKKEEIPAASVVDRKEDNKEGEKRETRKWLIPMSYHMSTPGTEGLEPVPKLKENRVRRNSMFDSKSRQEVFAFYQESPHLFKWKKIPEKGEVGGRGCRSRGEWIHHFRHLFFFEEESNTWKETVFLVCIECYDLLECNPASNRPLGGMGKRCISHIRCHVNMDYYPALREMDNPLNKERKEAEFLFDKFMEAYEKGPGDNDYTYLMLLHEETWSDFYHGVKYVGKTRANNIFRQGAHMAEAAMESDDSQRTRNTDKDNGIRGIWDQKKTVHTFNFYLHGDYYSQVAALHVETLMMLALGLKNLFNKTVSASLDDPTTSTPFMMSLSPDQRYLLGSYFLWLAYNEYMTGEFRASFTDLRPRKYRHQSNLPTSK